MKTIGELIEENNDILLRLDALEKACVKLESGGKVAKAHLEQIIEFFSDFSSIYPHSKEEDLIFKAMKKAGMISNDLVDGVVITTTIASMLKERENARAFLRNMQKALAKYRSNEISAVDQLITSAKAFIALERKHIDREVNDLYPMAYSYLSRGELAGLYEQFEQVAGESG
ncbi:MAG: hemerythrin domain-containing protein [Candidatus Hodarchaeota archaeon]